MNRLINAVKGINKLGLALVIGAVTLVATQSAFKSTKTGQYTFKYIGTNHNEANVEDETKWVYTTDAITCDDVPQEACSIIVDESYVNNPSTSPTLKSTLNLSATPYTSTLAFVDGSNDINMEIVNRSAQ